MKNIVAKNYLYNALYQIYSVVTPLIVTPYTARILGSEGVGTFGYTQSIATYFVLLGTLGTMLLSSRNPRKVANKNP